MLKCTCSLADLGRGVGRCLLHAGSIVGLSVLLMVPTLNEAQWHDPKPVSVYTTPILPLDHEDPASPNPNWTPKLPTAYVSGSLTTGASGFPTSSGMATSSGIPGSGLSVQNGGSAHSLPASGRFL